MPTSALPEIRVAVDGRPLAGQRTGIGVWLGEVVERWAAADRPVTLLVPPGADPGLHVDTVTVDAPFHLSALRFARRHRYRYFSADSMIVSSLLGPAATVTVHDLAPLVAPQQHHRRARLAFRALLGLAARRCAALVVPSEATRADLVRLFPMAETRAHVVPEAARRLPARAPLPEGVRRPFVLFTGTLEPRKQAVELVEAFAAVAPEGWQLVLAGKRGWLSGEQHTTLDRYRGDDRVRELGFVSNATLAGLLADASAFAYPSALEGFGLPVLEGMAAGLPVLTTTAAALREVAGDAALLVDLDGPEPFVERLAGGLRRLLTDDDLRGRLAAAGLRRAGEFSWDRTAEQVWTVVSAAPVRGR